MLILIFDTLCHTLLCATSKVILDQIESRKVLGGISDVDTCRAESIPGEDLAFYFPFLLEGEAAISAFGVAEVTITNSELRVACRYLKVLSKHRGN